jgi:hypothetical protein
MGVVKTKGDRIELGKGGRAIVFDYGVTPAVDYNQPENWPTLPATVNFVTGPPTSLVAVRLPQLLAPGQMVVVTYSTSGEEPLRIAPYEGDWFATGADEILLGNTQVAVFFGTSDGWATLQF